MIFSNFIFMKFDILYTF